MGAERRNYYLVIAECIFWPRHVSSRSFVESGVVRTLAPHPYPPREHRTQNTEHRTQNTEHRTASLVLKPESEPASDLTSQSEPASDLASLTTRNPKEAEAPLGCSLLSLGPCSLQVHRCEPRSAPGRSSPHQPKPMRWSRSSDTRRCPHPTCPSDPHQPKPMRWSRNSEHPEAFSSEPVLQTPIDRSRCGGAEAPTPGGVTIRTQPVAGSVAGFETGGPWFPWNPPTGLPVRFCLGFPVGSDQKYAPPASLLKPD